MGANVQAPNLPYLIANESVIDALFLHEFIMSSDFLDSTFIHTNDHIRCFHCRQSVRYYNGRSALTSLQDQQQGEIFPT